MISSQKALEIILDQAEDFGVEEIPFTRALNRVLKEEIVADRDFPPFDRVSMDGIAFDSDTFDKGTRNFPVESLQAAGSKQLNLKNSENCIEVMTGAILPKNTNTVIRYEDIELKNGIATIKIETIIKGQNIHQKGLDRRIGDILIRKNTLISPAEAGVLATVGKKAVQVAKTPRVMVISTGDELVEVDEIPAAYQIRRSNVYTLVSLLKRLEISADNDHIIDDKAQLKDRIKEYLDTYDVLLFSGAVSKGKYDHLPDILEELGVEKLFHRVAQRPGKPFWYGKKNKVSVFAFPGNPVSTFVGCLKYFYPWYQKSVGIAYNHKGKAILSEDFEFKPELTYFLQVKLDMDGGLKLSLIHI